MTLQIAGRAFDSHLLLDSGGLPNAALLAPIIEAAEPALVTVSMRRTSSLAAGGPLSTIRRLGVPVLPNTAGCLSAREAILTAELAREALGTDWIKLEVIGDERSEGHTSELQSLMRISYAVFCLKKKNITNDQNSWQKYKKL